MPAFNNTKSTDAQEAATERDWQRFRREFPTSPVTVDEFLSIWWLGRLSPLAVHPSSPTEQGGHAGAERNPAQASTEPMTRTGV